MICSYRLVMMFMFLALTCLTACGNGQGSAVAQSTHGVAPGTAALTVRNLESSDMEVPRELFGVNISARINKGWACPFENTADPAFQESFRALGLPAVRVNMGGVLMGMIFPSSGSAPDWECLDTLLENLASMHDGKLMVTLGSLPDWLDISSDEDRKTYAALSQQVAERFMAFGIRPDHWEVLNEPESRWLSQYDDVCLLFNETAKWIKANDPTAMVGGPVLTWPKDELIEKFLDLSGDYADFISYHEYGTTDLELGTFDVMDRTVKFSDSALRISGLIDKYKGGQGISLTEYNLNSSWSPYTDPRQATAEGAVFVSLALMNAAEGGVESAYIWEAYTDGSFGVIDENNNLRPSGRALSILAKSLRGKIVSAGITAAPGEAPPLKSMATKATEGDYTVVIANYGDEGIPVDVSLPSDWGERVFVNEISRAVPDGVVYEGVRTDTGATIESPAMSLLVLRAG